MSEGAPRHVRGSVSCKIPSPCYAEAYLPKQEPTKPLSVDVIIPCRNEEATLGAVIAAIPTQKVRTIVVVDNGSVDRSAQVAEDAGAVVVRETRIGYGAACLRGVYHLSAL